MKHLCDGEFYHNDHAKYQVHMQSCVYGCKPILLRTETKDIFSRICGSDGDVDNRIIGRSTLPAIPRETEDFLEGSECWKVEWMDHGRYRMVCSPMYEENFMEEGQILDIARKHNIPPKLVDHSGLNNFDMAYRMWSESMFIVGAVVNYTGSGYWKSDGVLCWTTLRVMTIQFNHSAMVTATRVSRGIKYTF